MKVQMQQQNNKAFGSVSNHLDPQGLEKYGIVQHVKDAIPQLKILTKTHGVHVDMFEHRGALKFDIQRGRFPYLSYLFSDRHPCGGFCYPGKSYFQIKNSQDIVDAAEKAITGVSKNRLHSKGTHDI